MIIPRRYGFINLHCSYEAMDPIFWIMFATGILIISLGAVIFSGRGAMLIAGYNTMSEERRARYDEGRLTRAVGLFMIALGIIFTVGMYGVLSDWLGMWEFLIIIAVAVIVGIVVSNSKYVKAD